MSFWPYGEAENFNWGFLLLALLVTTSASTIIPNHFNQLKNSRSHNADRFMNEWLARMQVAFMSYFFTPLIVLDIEAVFLKRGLQVLVLVTVIFFSTGLYYAATQDDIISEHHQCPTESGTRCNVSLYGVRRKIYGLNLVLAVISLVIAIGITFSEGIAKSSKLTKPTQTVTSPEEVSS